MEEEHPNPVQESPAIHWQNIYEENVDMWIDNDGILKLLDSMKLLSGKYP